MCVQAACLEVETGLALERGNLAVFLQGLPGHPGKAFVCVLMLGR